MAPRGFGKTSLLRRIAIAVQQDDSLRQRYIALTFREEQHNVLSLDLFWRNCLQALAEAREDEGADDAEMRELDAMWDRFPPRRLKREEQDGEPAWQAFRAWCETQQRRPLLLVDNLDALLAGLPERQQWHLRSLLQQAGGPWLLAAASRYPEECRDPKAAFHDFFRITTLPPLSQQEVLHCLSELASRRGESGKAVQYIVDNDPGRIAALNTMSGGNPRTLGILYSVLENRMHDDVLQQLQAMLDTFTGWYQARTEELPMQTRAVFDALALHWNPATAATLSELTGLDTSTVSSHLNRLEKTGYVESVALSSKKTGRNGYQVSERFYNIWYLMRHGSRKVKLEVQMLTRFLRTVFSESELLDMARMRTRLGGQSSALLAFAAAIPAEKMRQQLIDMAKQGLGPEDAELDWKNELMEIRKNTRPPRRNKKKEMREYIDDMLNSINSGLPEQAYYTIKIIESSLDKKLASIFWFSIGAALMQKNNSPACIHAFERCLANEFPEPSLNFLLLLEKEKEKYSLYDLLQHALNTAKGVLRSKRNEIMNGLLEKVNSIISSHELTWNDLHLISEIHETILADDANDFSILEKNLRIALKAGLPDIIKSLRKLSSVATDKDSINISISYSFVFGAIFPDAFDFDNFQQEFSRNNFTEELWNVQKSLKLYHSSKGKSEEAFLLWERHLRDTPFVMTYPAIAIIYHQEAWLLEQLEQNGSTELQTIAIALKAHMEGEYVLLQLNPELREVCNELRKDLKILIAPYHARQHYLKLQAENTGL
ncbi:MarR family transcriptional regulator [Massilia sp. W12]|uniref:MarR family transcriptional regulator n=1 Tax=Massilia sp. W12 TaxID=3126507 RepID=UPI0030CDC43B